VLPPFATKIDVLKVDAVPAVAAAPPAIPPLPPCPIEIEIGIPSVVEKLVILQYSPAPELLPPLAPAPDPPPMASTYRLPAAVNPVGGVHDVPEVR
jgi:hypothetical protein